MAIKNCPHCSNTGYLGDRFCKCRHGGRAFRKALDMAPEFAEYRRKRAEIEHMMGLIERGELRLERAADYWRAAKCPPGSRPEA